MSNSDEDYDDDDIDNVIDSSWDDIEEEKVKEVVVDPKIKELKLAFGDKIDAYYALMEVEDLRFSEIDKAKQKELVDTLVTEYFKPGEYIIKQGGKSDAFYFILGSPDNENANSAEVEVVKELEDGTLKIITALSRGHYFGEKTFVSRVQENRNASIRVSLDCESTVKIGKVPDTEYSKWTHFRTFLLMKEVPLIRSLPHSDQLEMYSKLKRKKFQAGDFIIREGDVGNEFYIILYGEATVQDAQHGVLAQLREGHAFGEMALLSDEPRVASVIAKGKCVCLCLEKVAFRTALSAEKFNKIVTDMMEKRKQTRMKRDQIRKDSMASRRSSLTSVGEENPFPELDSLWGDAFDGKVIGKSPLRTTGGTFYTTGSEVTFTSKLSIRKSPEGDRFINKYKLIKELGKGSFGSVYQVRDEVSKEMCAMKAVNRSVHWGSKVDVMSEIEIMKYLNQENVVSLRGVIDDPTAKKIFIIQEFMAGGCLMNDEMTTSGVKHDPVPFNDTVSHKYFCDILKGMNYLHSLGIIHRDMKPQNVLMTADGVCKISDFGSAISVYSKSSRKLAVEGTPAFMAPELFNDPTPDSQKSPAVDIFALGATLYCMMLGKTPWMAKDQIDLASKITKFEVTYPVDCKLDPHVKHLLNRMMDKDPFDRIEMEDIIRHDWVTSEGSYSLYGLNDRKPSRFPLHIGKPRRSSRDTSGSSIVSSSSEVSSLSSKGSGMSGVVFPHSAAHALFKCHSLGYQSGSIAMDHSTIAPRAVKLNSLQPNSSSGRPPTTSRLYNGVGGSSRVDEDNSLEFAMARDLDMLNERHRGQQMLINKIGRPSSPGDALSGQDFNSASAHVLYLGSTIIDPSEVGNAAGRNVKSTNLMNSDSIVPLPQIEEELRTSELSADALMNLTGASTPESVSTVSENGSADSSTVGSCTVTYQLPQSELRAKVPAVNEVASRKKSGLTRTGMFEIIPTEITINSSGEKVAKSVVLEAADVHTPHFGSSKRPSSTRGASRKQSGFSVHGSSIAGPLHSVGSYVSSNTEKSGTPEEIKGMKTMSTKELTKAVSSLGQASMSHDSGDNWGDVNSLAEELCTAPTASQGHNLKQTCGGDSGESVGNLGNIVEDMEICDDSDDSDDSDYSDVAEGNIENIDDVGIDTIFDIVESVNTLAKEDDSFDPLDEIADTARIAMKLRRCGNNCGPDSSNRTLGLRCGLATDIGKRVYMEDRVCSYAHLQNIASSVPVTVHNGTVSPMPGSLTQHLHRGLSACNEVESAVAFKNGVQLSLKNNESLCFLSVIDGHNGDYVANYLQSALPVMFYKGMLNAVPHERALGESFKAIAEKKPKRVLGIKRFLRGGKTSRELRAMEKQESTTSITSGGTLSSVSTISECSELCNKNIKVDSPVDIISEKLVDVCAVADRQIVEIDFAKQQKVLAMGRNGENNNGCGGGIQNVSFGGAVGVCMVVVDEEDSFDISFQRVAQSRLHHPLPFSSVDSLDIDVSIPKEPSARKRKLIIANVGDCGVVVSERGIATKLTSDHKPDKPEEKKRIEAAGGFVHRGRVNGVLAVSRSFGDIMYKNVTVDVKDDSSECVSPSGSSAPTITVESPTSSESLRPSQREEGPEGLWCTASQQVISKPDIVEYSIGYQSEFVVMASDGLWDVVTPQESVNFVRRQLYDHGTIDRAAQELLAKALERGSTDNISILICCFNQEIESPSASPVFSNLNKPQTAKTWNGTSNNTNATCAIFSPNLKSSSMSSRATAGSNTKSSPDADPDSKQLSKNKRRSMTGDRCTQS